MPKQLRRSIFPGVRRPNVTRFEKAFAPFALEIGYLARSWNGLHERLCSLFCQIVDKQNVNVPAAIWQAVASDRTQRQMLGAAYLAPGAINQKTYPWAMDAIKFLLKETDALANQRNDAIHAPMNVMFNLFSREFEIRPDLMQNNAKAKRFREKRILDELKWYRAKADVLNQYCMSIWFHLRQTDGSSPEKPLMPTLGQMALPRPARRKNRLESDPLKAEPSQE